MYVKYDELFLAAAALAAGWSFGKLVYAVAIYVATAIASLVFGKKRK